MLKDQVIDYGPDADPALRYYVREGGFGASSWSPEAAKAKIAQMRPDGHDQHQGGPA